MHRSLHKHGDGVATSSEVAPALQVRHRIIHLKARSDADFHSLLVQATTAKAFAEWRCERTYQRPQDVRLQHRLPHSQHAHRYTWLRSTKDKHDSCVSLESGIEGGHTYSSEVVSPMLPRISLERGNVKGAKPSLATARILCSECKWCKDRCRERRKIVQMAPGCGGTLTESVSYAKVATQSAMHVSRRCFIFNPCPVAQHTYGKA